MIRKLGNLLSLGIKMKLAHRCNVYYYKGLSLNGLLIDNLACFDLYS